MKGLKTILPTSIAVFLANAQGALAQIDIPVIQPSGANDLIEVMENLGGWILGIAGGIAVLYLIYGGIIYITGGEKGAEKGKTLIVNAIIGIAVIALATVIANAVITAIG